MWLLAVLLLRQTRSEGRFLRSCDTWDVTRGHKVNRRAKLDLTDCALVHLSGVDNADGLVVALARALENGKNSHVVQISLVNVAFGDNGLFALGKMLETNTGLNTFIILANAAVGFGMAPITHRASAKFGHGIGVHTGLERLRLGDFVTDAVAVDIAKAFAVNSNGHLREVRIGHGVFGDIGAAAFAEALMLNTIVSNLSFEENHIGDAGAIALSKWIAKSGSLLYDLNLSHNNISDDGALAVADAIAVAGEHRNQLARLDLMENDIGDAGGRGLADAVRINSRVEQLRLDGNLMRRKVLLEVQHALVHSGSKKGVLATQDLDDEAESFATDDRPDPAEDVELEL